MVRCRSPPVGASSQGGAYVRFGTFHLIGAPDMAPGERRVAETLEHIALADELGLDHAWIAEHHFSG